MLRIRKANDRGQFDHGWLNTSHTFSFGSYHDPDQMGFRSLRVMNEDHVAPGKGFGTHGHRDMEIISYILSGELEHKDSLGTGSVLVPGQFQKMSAGTGVEHSEFNPSAQEPVHFYQIWIVPDQKGLPPSYQERSFPDDELENQFRLVASPQGESDSFTIHQDVSVYLSRLQAGKNLTHPLEPQRHAWLQVLRGQVVLNEERLDTSDGVAISDESEIEIYADTDTELMFFDLA